MKRTTAADALTELILEVFRVNGDLLAEGNRITEPFGQTSARWQVLGAIRTTPQPVAGIARDMGLARQSVQRTADLLAAEGVGEYVDNPAHRRAKLVRLTPHGKEVLAEISRQQVAWTNHLAEVLPFGEEQIRAALAVLQHLRAELEQPRDSNPNRASHDRQAAAVSDTKEGVRDGQRGPDQPLRGPARRRRKVPDRLARSRSHPDDNVSRIVAAPALARLA
jgi:DNA-binding MarR family transcriptional regulator